MYHIYKVSAYGGTGGKEAALLLIEDNLLFMTYRLFSFFFFSFIKTMFQVG